MNTVEGRSREKLYREKIEEVCREETERGRQEYIGRIQNKDGMS